MVPCAPHPHHNLFQEYLRPCTTVCQCWSLGPPGEIGVLFACRVLFTNACLLSALEGCWVAQVDPCRKSHLLLCSLCTKSSCTFPLGSLITSFQEDASDENARRKSHHIQNICVLFQVHLLIQLRWTDDSENIGLLIVSTWSCSLSSLIKFGKLTLVFILAVKWSLSLKSWMSLLLLIILSKRHPSLCYPLFSCQTTLWIHFLCMVLSCLHEVGGEKLICYSVNYWNLLIYHWNENTCFILFCKLIKRLSMLNCSELIVQQNKFFFSLQGRNFFKMWEFLLKCFAGWLLQARLKGLCDDTVSVLFMPSGNMLRIEIGVNKMQFSRKNCQIRGVREFQQLQTCSFCSEFLEEMAV